MAEINALAGPRALDDTAGRIKNGLAAAWKHGDPLYPERAVEYWVPTLHVDDNWQPDDQHPQLLVADDGGPQAILQGHWAAFHGEPKPRGFRRPLLRLTAFAAGRDRARCVVMTGADWVCSNKGDVGITRVEDVSDPLITRDRATGAYLASVTMPVIIRQA